jgi:hypothetical protein
VARRRTQTAPDVKKYVLQLLGILDRDEHRLTRIDDYLHGRHDDPYMPANCDEEYKLLARRAISNWMPLFVATPAQSLYVDGFRRGTVSDGEPDSTTETADDKFAASPEMDHWQRSRMDARQGPVMRGALGYGHSFVLTEKDGKSGKSVSKGLSALRTSALYEDPANDIVPQYALTITKSPNADAKQLGVARFWDPKGVEYRVTFDSMSATAQVTISRIGTSGAKENPVTRFAAAIDLEGRTIGVIEPLMALQDRLNQTVFDLLLAQTYNSTEVRTVSGMAPPMEMDPVFENPDDPTEVTGMKPRLDTFGRPIPKTINHNSKRFLFAESKDAKFGSLPGSPLDGFISSVDMTIRHLSAISQTPPHYLLGQIANISADALAAAETSLQRKIAEIRKVFGESWERVFRIAAEIDELASSAEDYHGEVLWRDMEQKSMAQSADALGKLSTQLGVPQQGLWPRIPGVTQNELASWADLKQQEDAQQQLADAINRATPDQTTTTGIPPRSTDQQVAPDDTAAA